MDNGIVEFNSRVGCAAKVVVFNDSSNDGRLFSFSPELTDDPEPGKTEEQLFLAGIVEEDGNLQVGGGPFDLENLADSETLVFDGSSRDDLRRIAVVLFRWGILSEPGDLLVKAAFQGRRWPSRLRGELPGGVVPAGAL